MKKHILFWLIVVPVISNAQRPDSEKLVSLTRHTRNIKNLDRACVCQHLNTAILFPKPPEFLALTNTPVMASTFTINACIKNLKSGEDIRLTLNGEEQPMRQQTPSVDKEAFCPNGYLFSYTLTESAAHNVISLEARNEGGATIRYLDVSTTK
jgi:hypothetical protein